MPSPLPTLDPNAATAITSLPEPGSGYVACTQDYYDTYSTSVVTEAQCAAWAASVWPTLTFMSDWPTGGVATQEMVDNGQWWCYAGQKIDPWSTVWTGDYAVRYEYFPIYNAAIYYVNYEHLVKGYCLVPVPPSPPLEPGSGARPRRRRRCRTRPSTSVTTWTPPCAAGKGRRRSAPRGRRSPRARSARRRRATSRWA